MQKILGNLIGMAAAAMVLFVIGVAPVHALVVGEATLSDGAVNVSGSEAAASAPISWEGVVVATADEGGSFAFTTTLVPADCSGTLDDGTSTLEVWVDGCSAVTPGLPGTGQSVIYAAGDDGDVRAGGALSYTDNGDGTVTDNRTGLVWEQKTDANVNEVYQWRGALDYVAALNTMNGGQGFAGHNDWRLPNVKELQSILDYSRSKPMIHPIFGPTMGILNSVFFWSSTSWAAFHPEGNAWGVDFADGSMAAFGKDSALRVRAVRGGF